MKNTQLIKSSGNVFKDVGFDPVEAKNLKFRSRLMSILIRYIQHEELTQKKAAKKLGVTQPRISNLMHGKIDLFSMDMLLGMMERAGFPIYKRIEQSTYLIFKKYDHHYSTGTM
jgi:predicted XRE-type DNA-binding protein